MDGRPIDDQPRRKLFALSPKLTPTEVIRLILDGTTKSTDGRCLLINPKPSVALLEAKR